MKSGSGPSGPVQVTGASDVRAAQRVGVGGRSEPRVCVDTVIGQLIVEVFTRRAPQTAANFLKYVDCRYLDSCSIYRIVTPDNQHPPPPVGASVVQWGLHLEQLASRPFPPVPHEPTSVTGLTHCNGALSLARFAPGTGSSEFFFCIGDQPQLDFGGLRNPDGAGFAAFGQLVSGEDILSEIYARAEEDHLLKRPIRIRAVSRLGGAGP
jgi:peptidyl-prolyl cis-trans isomerase A (cyclophilin A)